MELEILRARGSDAKEMLAYLNQIGSETDNMTFGAEGFPIDLEGETQYLENNRNNPYNAIFVARLDGKLVGDVSFEGSPRPRLRHRGTMGISVLKEAWGMGVGSKLMQTIIDYARDTAQAELLSLDVRCDNTQAIRLYERFGFVKTGTIPGMLKISGQLVDCYTMTLTL